ncbi:class A beta-lactamase [Mycetocola zhadangensis]|uniref:Beta-lactamase n=1 Tax=Mycetocola zhadangensis TaxID=1164595 RepID=A0A3L7J112_9MICO|nr:class A beta-lactamase [Mycetocola zhadangensis]RLQ84206.1 class A beta-lactamase [Mycetocola zhadangensis]GGE95177.1 beta-lactamase [Mycetocola zhadangensis]
MPHSARLASLSFILAMGALTGCAAGPANSTATQVPPATAEPTPIAPAADAQFGELEAKFDARLGVYALDTGTGLALEYRSDERFAYASTIKVFASAVLLDQTTDSELDSLVRYDESDLLDYAPITEQHVDTGMTLRELGDAAVRYSDNTAANLIFERIGGPTGLATALKAMGDDVTQVDRTEPELNETTPGDPRDTTTPEAFAVGLEALILGDALELADRETLTEWLVGNTTGDNLIRAGVPTEWTVGDKTGSAGYGTRNDIAVIWPTEGDPIVLAVLSSRAEPDAEYDDDLIAEATAVAIDALKR